jgi:hypothetical protein
MNFSKLMNSIYASCRYIGTWIRLGPFCPRPESSTTSTVNLFGILQETFKICDFFNDVNTLTDDDVTSGEIEWSEPVYDALSQEFGK